MYVSSSFSKCYRLVNVISSGLAKVITLSVTTVL
jgi:hypothetical protein